MKSINAFLGLLGLGSIGFGCYVLFSGYEDAYSVGMSDVAVYAPLGVGCMLFVLGILGFCGAKHQSVKLLLLYFCLLLVLIAVMGSTAVILFAYAGTLDNVSVGNSADLVDSLEGKINDFQIAVYDVCCAAEGFGDPSIGCNENITDGCYLSDDASYDKIKGTIADSLCSALEKVEIDGAAIVGDPNITAAACGGGDPAVFQNNIATYVEGEVEIAAYIVSGIGGLILFTMLFSCILMCKKKEGVEGDEYSQRAVSDRFDEYDQQKAANMAY